MKDARSIRRGEGTSRGLGRRRLLLEAAFGAALRLGLRAAVCAAVCAVVWAAGTSRTMAQEVVDTATARALFEQGMEAVDRGDYEVAADRLSRSLRIHESVVVRTNLALALIELGRLVEASEHLRRVQHQTEEGSPPHQVATERLASLEGRIGELQVDVSGVLDGVEVRVDGRRIASAAIGVPQPANPGDHEVTLHRGERQIAAARTSVEAGRRAAVSLTAPPPSPREVAQGHGGSSERSDLLDTRQPSPSDTGGVAEQWWLWTLVAVVALGAAAGITAAVLLSDGNEVEPLRGSSGNTFRTLLEAP